MNNAWNLDHTKKQWVDLGIHSVACMTRPETCGAAGGAISLWANLISCSDSAIISSVAYDLTGSLMYCARTIGYNTHVFSNMFSVYYSFPDK